MVRVVAVPERGTSAVRTDRLRRDRRARVSLNHRDVLPKAASRPVAPGGQARADLGATGRLLLSRDCSARHREPEREA
jgi:hypothetical protein